MKFFITGATGFIGTHLTQALVKQGKEVTVLRNQSAALDALVTEKENLRSIKADLLDTRAMAEALRGHDVVVHLAYASRGTPEEQYRITVEGTKCVLQAATEANVQRFIHMSTASTYGEPPKDKTYTEEDPRYASLELYPSLKQEAELAVLQASHGGTEVVILQPSIIYGPGKGYWTEGILKTLRKNLFPLVNGGQGLCNLIHVYDVVEAVILAATVPGIDGECFLLANDQPVTWAMFLEAYQEILGKRCLLNVPTQAMKKYNFWSQYRRKIREYKFYIKVLKVFFKVLQFPDVRKKIDIPANERIDFFAAKPHFSNQKAKSVLGFKPKVTLEEGMATIQNWLEKT